MNFPPDYPYDVREEIARGGMGVVLDALDVRLGREVALKVALPRMLETLDGVTRFLREARILARLDHPNIAPIHELGITADGRPFYSMKRIRGRNLQEIIRGLRDSDEATVAQYPLPSLLTIFQKVCDAVAFAHSQGVIHRDLKPENIMIGEFGEVLVMDWGIAKVRERGESQPSSGIPPKDTSAEVEGFQELKQMPRGSALTLDGQIMGTPQFMAPEQAGGRVTEHDERTDIFALGGILYSLLTLRPPTLSRNVREILKDVKSGYIPPPVYYNQVQAGDAEGALGAQPIPLRHCPGQTIPEALSFVTMKAMAVDRAARYPSVAALRAEIAAWQGGQATIAEEAGLAKRLGLLLKRHRPVAVALTCVLVAALGFTAWLVAGERKAWGILDRQRANAPVFRDLAVTLQAQGKSDEALTQLEAGIRLQPSNADFHLLKGHLLQTVLRLAEAKQAYERALELDSSLRLASTNAALCASLLARAPRGTNWPTELIDELRLAATMQGRPVDALRLAGRIKQHTPAYDQRWQKAFQATGIRASFGPAGVGFQLRDGSGTKLPSFAALKGFPLTDLSIASDSTELAPLAGMPLEALSAVTEDLSPLRGMPLQRLNLSNSKLTDLSPLRGMPLKVLVISGTHVSDLNPLAGAPLVSLNLSSSRVFNLEPLRGMPIKYLSDVNLSGTSITNLSALTGMPLSSLLMEHCRGLQNLEPLRGMPLRKLSLRNTRVRDLEPLRGMPLEYLLAQENDNLSDIRPLAGMPLQFLGLGLTKVADLSPIQGMPLTALDVSNTRVVDVHPLKGMPLNRLSLSNTKVTDLRPLQGMPLTDLNLSDTRVSDLTALKSAPLKAFNLSQTVVRDLAPLSGSPLESLSLAGCQAVTDIAPLAGLPVRELNLYETSVKDLAPLTNCVQMETLILPRGATPRSVEKLRAHPKLGRLSFENHLNAQAMPTASEFWKAWDAGQRK